jgi:DNA-binding transcriptional LysR family regulator
MDVDRLRYFCTVAQTVNIHRAAELLGLSPAALSKSIKVLEHELNTKLVAPSGRGIVITDQGRDLALNARKVLEDLTLLESTIRTPHPAQTRLRLGSFEVFTTYFMGRALKEFPQDIELILHELTPGKLEEALIERHVDLGITYIPIPRAELDFVKVTTIRMAAFTRRGAFRRQPLAEIPFAVPVTPIYGSPTKVNGLDGWPDHLATRNCRYRVTLMETAMELSRAGLAATYLPKFIVELHNEQVKEEYRLEPLDVKLNFPESYLEQPVYLVKRKTDDEGPVMKKVAKVLRRLER